MPHPLLAHLRQSLDDLQAQGLLKRELEIATPQAAEVTLTGGDTLLNLCANNYLGLANDPDLIAAAHTALDTRGFGMASVRFIIGTQDLHRTLEKRLAAWLGTDDAILYSSCFDANGGLFETLLGEEDAVISDALNHASIIDGIRLSKARRLRYANNNMAELEALLQSAQDARHRLIAVDGVFSMDGSYANLPAICALAERYGAMVMVDDSHAVGFVGVTGAGTPEHFGVRDKVQLLTGTFGKALGGASGGYIAGPQVVVDWLRQRSRPYLFSNSVAPMIAAATLAALDKVQNEPERRARVFDNARYFRAGMEAAGFTLLPGEHPIVPVMLGDAKLAQRFAARMVEEGVYVVAFSYPVVPMGAARIRTQMTAAHTRDELDRIVAAFVKVGRELNLIGGAA
jgi:glycine C-acetyltransferase